MKIVLDEGLCEANGVCARLAGDVFQLGDDDRLTVLVDEVPNARLDAVRFAVARCPKQALSLRED